MRFGSRWLWPGKQSKSAAAFVGLAGCGDSTTTKKKKRRTKTKTINMATHRAIAKEMDSRSVNLFSDKPLADLPAH